jgi:hypothetical protein
LALAALAGLLRISGLVLVRAGIARRDLWRALESSVLWTAAFAGLPVYLLQQHSELYFGGTSGLVQDSYLSLIDRTFHGRTYAAGQTPLVFTFIVATVAAFCIVLYVNWRRGTPARMMPAACLLALILVPSLLEVVQRCVLHTPYFVDRTALFYVPLYVLFVTFLFEGIGASWPAGRAIVRLMLGGAVVLAALHFVATANTTSVLEWPDDASIKVMMTDLRAATSERPAGTRVVLGLEPRFAPSAVYYARRTSGASVDIVAPAPPGIDFFYGAEERTPAGMEVIRRYPATRTALARAAAPR